MAAPGYNHSYHDFAKTKVEESVFVRAGETRFTYTFENFFHPFVGELIARLNEGTLADLMDVKWQADLRQDFFKALYDPQQNSTTRVEYFPKEIDVSLGGPYAVYNWELFFHIPLTVAVHLSKTQRFAEAARWFHFIFDPTSNDKSVAPPARFWKFLGFRGKSAPQIDELLLLLSKPESELDATERRLRDETIAGYNESLRKPFQPHVVARTRLIAYQYNVVMKYLDNLIAWGDHLFQQDTVESINEATQRYVLAANLLGPRPQRIPPRGEVRPKTFAQLKALPNDPMGNALVELEGQFPFNLAPAGGGGGAPAGAGPLFGIGRTLYFCLPRNDKLLGYWDTVADRLFKIRHCMNIEGVVRPLALFDPPVDPGMLVKAAAAGLDIGSVVSGLNRPPGPVRSLTLIQKALELCGEVRALGGALLSAIEKGDAERLGLTRQQHELKIQRMTQEVRYLQWQSAREATTSLLTGRRAALERLRHYGRLLNAPPDQNAPDAVTLDRRELTEENFDEAYAALVAQYDKPLAAQPPPRLKPAGGGSPSQQSGATGPGQLHLDFNEDMELNVHLPEAHSRRFAAIAADTTSAVLSLIPDMGLDLHFWGLGGHAKLFGGTLLAGAGRFVSAIQNIEAADHESGGGRASKTAGYARRADDWVLQYNLAAQELMQSGRQVLTSLIAEQVAHHEYLNVRQQIEQNEEVHAFLRDKFSNEDLYLWMQGEISRLYYEYYRFAFDTARRAERAMKQELMRPELESQDFVKFNYWDGGRKGLLSGEALHLDLKRMEMAYHDHNKRELELTRHVSLRQLDPLALLTLKATGTCQVTIPEWLYDRDCPGHYMRRIKSVAVSVPSVVGPYTSVNCTLSLLRSSVRKSPLPKDGEYARQGAEDDRFVDYAGAIQSVVTSGASNDTGMFEASLRDERYLPFENAGAVSSWKLELPKDYPAFDYATISDVILHVRYTARQGVDPTKVKQTLDDLFQEANQAGLALLFSLRHDFPTEWAAFVGGAADFGATIRRDFFPYFTQGKDVTVTQLELYGRDVAKHHATGNPAGATDALADEGQFTYSAPPDPAGPTQVLRRAPDAQAFLLVRYTIG
ncbi:MAG TPA: hypothetical protein VN228_11105 [Pyrinomonadaceae bacterium]|nr:hypothetical protein [Pyrinomonadaceae bacterium]